MSDKSNLEENLNSSHANSVYDELQVKDSLDFCYDIEKYYNKKINSVENTIKNTETIELTRLNGESVPCATMEQTSFVEKEKKSVIVTILKQASVLILCFLLAYGIASFVNEYFIHQTRVDGISMQDTLNDNDYLLVNKLTYRFKDPERFDIVIFPYDYNVFYIKRIIGLPNETIQIKDGFIYVNGEKLEESYGKEMINDGGIATNPILLGQDEYFVMGDNRNYSTDSRDINVGIIPKEKIIGKAWFRIFPLKEIKILE